MEIKFRNLTYSYKGCKSTLAIDNISAVIKPGLWLLMGENGAGKTTLLHLIAGLLFPSSGECKIDGASTSFRLPSISSHIFFTGVGIDFPYRTINQLIKYHAPFYPNFSKELLIQNLTKFGLNGNEKISSLSLGNQQKAKLAYALSLQTPILLLDEPANGLDIESKREMQKLIANTLRPDQTVIVSTHSVSDLENLYDGVIDLHNGKLAYALTLEEIQERFSFEMCDKVPANAIYAEQRFGRFCCLLPNSESRYSEPDYELMYMAVRKKGSLR